MFKIRNPFKIPFRYIENFRFIFRLFRDGLVYHFFCCCCCNQRLLEQIELYEVSNFHSASPFLQLFGQLCTIPALRDVCRFMIGAVFGTYEPNNYYDVMYLKRKKNSNTQSKFAMKIILIINGVIKFYTHLISFTRFYSFVFFPFQ